MAKEIIGPNGGGLPALPKDFASKLSLGISKSRTANPTVGGGKDILKLGKADGVWVYGQSTEEVQSGSRWFIPPNSLVHGWVRWENAQKKEVMTYIYLEEMPPQPPMIGTKEFVVQNGFEAKCLTGQDRGHEVIYRTPAVGGRRAFEKLLVAFQQQSTEDPDHLCAVITLSSEWYPHDEYGKIWNPIFTIVGWADMEGNMADEAGADTSAPAPEPIVTAAAAPERPASGDARPRKPPLDVNEPQPTAAAHVGQRRRPGK